MTTGMLTERLKEIERARLLVARSREAGDLI